MLFIEGRFLVFFLLVFAVHWSLRSLRLRKLWLLAASYAFYAAWNWKFLSLIIASTVIDYLVGRGLGRAEGTVRRKGLLLISVCANLGFLGFFKYYNFFAEEAVQFLSWLGFHPSDVTLNIVLPVGISFYTFQTMSYTIDVYRRNLDPIRSLVDFATFVAFFPQLVAGPIVRAIDFLPQLRTDRVFSRHVDVRGCLALFLFGYVKKACLADNVSVVVDEVFSDPESYSTLSTWVSLAMYHIQVYGDFSGYSDMAIATAGLLGYRLTENFAFPYFSPSIGEFWRRWHISLGSWLKDYLYIPLGGSWCSWPKRIRNIFVTMVLCGMWHGAGWQYATFGAVHAAYVVINRFWKHGIRPRSALGVATRYSSHVLTTLCLFLSWTIFRSEGLGKTRDMLEIFLFLEPGGPRTVSVVWGALFAGCAVVHWVFYRRYLHPLFGRLPDWAFSVVYGAAWALTLPWVATGYKPFIYFQF